MFTSLDHPNIVRVVDAITKDKCLYLVLEREFTYLSSSLCRRLRDPHESPNPQCSLSFFFLPMTVVEGGSAVLMKESFVNLPESLLAKYISKCLKGLAYLHTNKIIHNDIKGVNILVTRDGQVKLADCVQPKLKGKKEALTIQPYWSQLPSLRLFLVITLLSHPCHPFFGKPVAPEVIKSNNESPASDVWSLGCTVVELLTGSPPYANFASMAAVMQIMKSDMPALPDGISPVSIPFLFLFSFYFQTRLFTLFFFANVRSSRSFSLAACKKTQPRGPLSTSYWGSPGSRTRLRRMMLSQLPLPVTCSCR